MTQRVTAGLLPQRDRAQFLSTFHRCLYPAPCGRGMRLDDSALADVPVSKCAAQRAVQIEMHRHQPCLATLAWPCCHL